MIVKLLGRKIGFKVFETRLQQLWVRKGIISLIDLGNEFFLVNFSHGDDQEYALTEGPWLIFDHYLTVCEWRPNFSPSTKSIERVAVWVRFSGLPIEYYDFKILSFIGHRSGRTVTVDKNILGQERGKYARLCVEVDLTKPLLAMFELKRQTYTIEYEGLHLLCPACGCFGHYLEGCAEKGAAVVAPAESTTRQDNDEGSSKPAVRPWLVVQKGRRPRRASVQNIESSQGKENSIGLGSRF